MSYAYKARDPKGKTLQGTLQAASVEDARQQLRRDGFAVLSIEEQGLPEYVPSGRIRKEEIVYLTNQLAIMVDTGVTLAAALAGIYEQEANPTLKRVLKELKTAVESGDDFSAALAKHPRYFDTTYISLIKASEQTGALGPMLDRIASYQRKQIEMRGKVRSALAYPCVMITIAIGVTTFLLTWVLPKFMPLFSRKGVKLPKSTIVMIAISESMTKHWQWWLVGLTAAIAGFIVWKRSTAGRRSWDWLKLRLPIFGTLFRKIALSRSIRTLGSMLAGGVSVLDALQLCRDVSGNYYYQIMWEQVLEDVTAGKQICESLAGNPLMPPTLVQMIRAGEDTASLGTVLERVSNYYDIEVENTVKATTGMIEPIIIAVMGVVVGGIGMSLLLPIFSLSSAH